MKAVNAEFLQGRRPGRGLVGAVIGATVLAIAAGGFAAWTAHHASDLRHANDDLERQMALAGQAVPVRETPPYADSAFSMLREHTAPWAPMLRALEGAAMVGVTPTKVEFDAADGSARVELAYSDPMGLFDYLDQLNAGLSPNDPTGRWVLIEAHAQAGGVEQMPRSMTPPPAMMSVASIRSVWSARTERPEAPSGPSGGFTR